MTSGSSSSLVAVTEAFLDSVARQRVVAGRGGPGRLSTYRQAAQRRRPCPWQRPCLPAPLRACARVAAAACLPTSRRRCCRLGRRGRTSSRWHRRHRLPALCPQPCRRRPCSRRPNSTAGPRASLCLPRRARRRGRGPACWAGVLVWAPWQQCRAVAKRWGRQRKTRRCADGGDEEIWPADQSLVSHGLSFRGRHQSTASTRARQVLPITRHRMPRVLLVQASSITCLGQTTLLHSPMAWPRPPCDDDSAAIRHWASEYRLAHLTATTPRNRLYTVTNIEPSNGGRKRVPAVHLSPL